MTEAQNHMTSKPNNQYISADDICTVGRMQTDFDMHGTGDNLWLQTGMYPSNVTLIPKQENQLWTPWVQGKCFPVMGTEGVNR